MKDSASTGELIQLRRTLHAIRMVNRIIAEATTRQELIERACGALVESRAWAGAWTVLIGADGQLIGCADRGMQGMTELYSEIEAGHLPRCAREAFDQQGVVSIEDVEVACPNCPSRPVERGHGVLGAPLVHVGRTYGYLHLTVAADSAPTNEERELVLETAQDIGLALHKIEVDEQRKRAERTAAYQARLLDRVSDAVISTDADFRVRTWNRAAERTYGWLAEEAVGRRVTELTRVEHDGITHEDVLEQFRNVGNWSGEVRQVRRDGTPVTVLSSVTLLRDAKGAPAGAVAVNRDVTERRQALSAMRDSEETYRTLVETLPDGVALIDLDGTMKRVNQGLVGMAGHSQHEELIGESLLQLVAPDHRDRAETNLLLTIESGNLKEVEYDLVRANGDRFPGEITTSVLRSSDERAQALVCIVRDISERKRVQSQLAQSDRMASVGMLAAGVAHEINNPLAYILGNLEGATQDLPLMADALRALRRGVQEALGGEKAAELLGDALVTPGDATIDEVVEETGDALRGAWRVRDIVRDLRVFARVDDRETEPLGVNGVVETAISLAYNEIKYRARLVKELQLVPLVLGNEGRLSQVFLNLLVNAAQAIDEGAAEDNTIRVRSRLEGGEVVVDVQDTGKGIVQSEIGQVFEAFFTTKPIGIGSGLGLAICRSIVHEHGGTIRVQSDLGVGATFTVRLPVAGRVDRAAGAGAGSGDVALPRGTRVLVVDDDPLVGAFLARVLGRRCDVMVLSSGAEAKTLLAEDSEFDAVLCDVMMPDISGIDLVEWLTSALPEVARRVVFMTGGVFTEKAQAFLERACIPTLEKPFDPVQLRREIGKVLDA